MRAITPKHVAAIKNLVEVIATSLGGEVRFKNNRAIITRDDEVALVATLRFDAVEVRSGENDDEPIVEVASGHMDDSPEVVADRVAEAAAKKVKDVVTKVIQGRLTALGVDMEGELLPHWATYLDQAAWEGWCEDEIPHGVARPDMEFRTNNKARASHRHWVRLPQFDLRSDDLDEYAEDAADRLAMAVERCA